MSMIDGELNLQPLNELPSFTILIIDDMANVRAELITNLRTLNFQGSIIEAATLTKAQEVLVTMSFDLVICDQNLPDGIGLDFLIALRNHPNLSKVPLLMCTTINDVPAVLAAIKFGANEYITKPWTKEILAKKILAVCAKL